MTGDPTRRRDRRARLVLHVLLGLGLVAMVGPFVWMVLSSFKPEEEIRRVPITWLPEDPTLANYAELFSRLDFPTYFTNSVVVAVLTTAGNLLFCSAAGYALAKLPFPGRRVLFGMVLGTIMVPNIVTIVPLFVLSSNLGLVDSVAGLVLPFLAQAFGVFLMRQFILSIPDDLLEAARIDGASELRVFWRIVLPLCRPALATLGILTFLASWNNFLWPLVAATTEDTYTLPVALALYAIGQNRTDYDLLLAGSVVVVLPVLVVFVLLQRHFVRGIATTGLK
ncbi:carbohydrate ABC transporter permease [Actinophytocola xanthii]|uniref:Sugar ABC transporter permease n=1 Tax=Actinophytocola xanthii TaxID=1912961 RepID=A0A1Q8CZ14_9PSEU|nr:carbohydrate ABC transporter permease [Actinophytocola xanthii]OLF19594.1 sugar ABC transporter permease [Actinophytocola xanthii]